MRYSLIVTTALLVFVTGFLLFCPAISFSQAPSAKTEIKKTIRGEVQLTRAFSNKAFTKVFSGVLNTGVSFHLGFQKKYNAGAYYSFTQYQIFPRHIEDPHTIQSTHTGGIKLIYDFVYGKGIFSPYLAGGYNWIVYSRLKCKNQQPKNTKSNTVNLGAGLTYNFLIDDEWTGAGFSIGYNLLNHTFNPDALCLNEWHSFKDSDKNGLQQNIYFGFSVYFDLAKKPRSVE